MYNLVVKDIEKSLEMSPATKKKFLNLIQKHPTTFHERTNLEGHITGSMLVFNRDCTKVLLTHHKKFQEWLQLGGHWDYH